MDAASKAKIREEYATHGTDTGSVEVQVAILTGRITELTEHLKIHTKDHHTRRGLRNMVSKRRSLLDYIMRKNQDRYVELIKRLGLRR